MTKTNLTVQLTGEDGNVFNLLSIVSKQLINAGYKEEAKELSERLWEQDSYDNALMLFKEYVNVVQEVQNGTR